MGMQQLDMFASFDPEPKPVVKKEPAVVAVPEVVEVLAEEAPQPAIVVDEVIVKAAPVPAPIQEQAVEAVAPSSLAESVVEAVAQPAATEAATQLKEVVFVDEKIAVKIKPKTIEAPVQSVEANVSKVVAAMKPKSKRGRKSYKEIDAEIDLIEIPEDEVLNQKLYYSITEVAKWFRVNASLLRYWENEFDILKPRKNRKGDRLFRPEDIKNLQVIYYLLRNRKFSLEGAKKYLRNNRNQVDMHVQLAQSLTKFRSFLLELKANLGA